MCGVVVVVFPGHCLVPCDCKGKDLVSIDEQLSELHEESDKLALEAERIQRQRDVNMRKLSAMDASYREQRERVLNLETEVSAMQQQRAVPEGSTIPSLFRSLPPSLCPFSFLSAFRMRPRWFSSHKATDTNNTRVFIAHMARWKRESGSVRK